MMSRGQDAWRRLEGPVPEGVDMDVGPVTVGVPPRDGRKAMVLSVVYAAIAAYLCAALAAVLTRGDEISWPARTLIAFGLVVVLLVSVLGAYRSLMDHREAARDRIRIDTDGVRILKDDTVLGEIVFDDGTGVNALLDREGPGFAVFTFIKGNRAIEFGTRAGISPDDMSRMWPVVEAAAWKHGMRTGENLRKMIDSEDG